jgi:hypothetical protein
LDDQPNLPVPHWHEGVVKAQLLPKKPRRRASLVQMIRQPDDAEGGSSDLLAVASANSQKFGPAVPASRPVFEERPHGVRFAFDFLRAIKQYIPTNIVPRLESDNMHVQQLAELRTVTVLFCLLPEQSFEAEEWSAQRESLDQLQQVVIRVQVQWPYRAPALFNTNALAKTTCF